MSAGMVKRTLDVAISGMALVALLPVLAVVAVTVRVAMGSPILFRQRRPGRLAKPFDLVKFRTMGDARGSDGTPAPDNARLTRLGRLLRRLSLDELPQFWNVLIGDMSLVGPRPLLMVYLPRYSKEQARRHEVKPGLTGWAQVNGRNSLSWEERFALDVWYVDHWSIGLDLRILCRTLLIVVRGRGVAQPGHSTMQEFEGDRG